jgi:hypothetical protein
LLFPSLTSLSRIIPRVLQGGQAELAVAAAVPAARLVVGWLVGLRVLVMVFFMVVFLPSSWGFWFTQSILL